MHIPSQIPPDKVTAEVLELCERLSPSYKPFYVEAKAEEWAVPFDRFGNVRNKVLRSGGSLVYGWEISELPQLYLEARFHAVWQSTDGIVTHISTENSPHERILFLRDPARKINGTVPEVQRLPLVHNPLLTTYWEAADGVRNTIEKFASAGFDVRHPVVCRELRPLSQNSSL